MKNEQKYKTAEERVKAFDRWRKTIKCEGCSQMCDKCEAGPLADECGFKWLTLEAEEEKPNPCPFCGGMTEVITDEQGYCGVSCIHCDYTSERYRQSIYAIAAHNRVCRAVEAVKKGETK